MKWNENTERFSTKSLAVTRESGQVCASAQLWSDVDGAATNLLVEFFFREEDDLLHKIKVTFPSGSGNEGNEGRQPWQAIYDRYEERVVVVDCEDETESEDRLRERQDQKLRPAVLIPTSIEIGKGEGERYRPHLKIHNDKLILKR
jgi:hypothetical protein